MKTRCNLIGEGYNAELVKRYSAEEQVSAQTPPAFIIISDDDDIVSPQHCILFYSALKEQNVRASMHIIPSGGHGWGAVESEQFNDWSVPLTAWLKNEILKNHSL